MFDDDCGFNYSSVGIKLSDIVNLTRAIKRPPSKLMFVICISKQFIIISHIKLM